MRLSAILSGLLLLVADQLVKYKIFTTMTLYESIPVVKGIFHLTYIQNPGAAFGILENQRIIFILVGVVILLAGVYFYRHLAVEPLLVQLGAALLWGGAIGNLIDRIWLGKVIDIFDFRIWPVFNIADIGICIGSGLIIYALIFLEETLVKKEL